MEVIKDALAGPMPEAFAPFVGELTVSELLLEWVPLMLACFLPLLCLPFVALGICGQESEEGGIKFGMRTAMKGMMLAVRADIRMGKDSHQTQLLKKAGFKKGGPSWMQPTSSAVEAGLAAARVRGSPPSGKKLDPSKGRAEEKAIKTGASRFY